MMRSITAKPPGKLAGHLNARSPLKGKKKRNKRDPTTTTRTADFCNKTRPRSTRIIHTHIVLSLRLICTPFPPLPAPPIFQV